MAISLSVALTGAQVTNAVVLPRSAITFRTGGQVIPNEGACVSRT